MTAHEKWEGFRRGALWLTALAVAFVAMIMPRALALDPQKGITQFSHRTWGAADGIAAVSWMTQTKDGYLWISANNGLFKFDGTTFARWQSPTGEPNLPGAPFVIHGSREGSLWISCADRIYRLQEGHIRSFGPDDGLPGRKVLAIFEAADGVIWAGTEIGLARFLDGKWEKMGAEAGLPEGGILAPCVGQDGTLWMFVGSNNRSPHCLLASLRPGEKHFQVAEEKLGVAVSMVQAPDGHLWVAETTRSVWAFPPNPAKVERVHPEIRVGSNSILFDRDGTFWVSTVGDGLRRARRIADLGTEDVLQYGDAVDQYTRKDGLSGDYVNHLFEDREGNIWVGTTGGLDCFRENKIAAMSVREGLPFDNNLRVQAVPDGSVWIATSPNGFAQLAPGQTRFVDRHWFGPKPGRTGFFTVNSIYADPSGDLFAGTGVGILVIRQDTADDLDNVQAMRLRDVAAMTRDSAGTLWISSKSTGLLGVQGRDGNTLAEIPGVKRTVENFANILHTDHAGRVWLATAIEGVTSYDRGTMAAHHYTRDDGLLAGEVRVIVSDSRDRVWVAGAGGISRFQQGRFQTLTGRQGLPEQNLSSLLVDAVGDFWMGGERGIFHVTALEVDRVLDSSEAAGQLHGEFFDSSDGLRGFLGLRNQDNPLATQSTDGRLWFVTNQGLAILDPKRLARNPLPPPIHVEKIIVGGQSRTILEPRKFPAGTRDCEIQYVALSFVDPAKVLYKYHLQGYDPGWVEAGTRRTASYSHLRPGKYRFQVIACNNDGVWNEEGDAIDFAITPAFYETPWFLFLCALPLGLALWGLYRLRLARVTARMNQHLEIQIKERKRIAQELHDTLLQGFTGVGLKLDAIRSQLPESLHATKAQLLKILEQSDRYLTEARRSVWELRSTSLENSDDFPRAIKEGCAKALEGTGIQLTCSVHGTPRKLDAAIEDNLLRICEEAVVNAARHASSTHVQMALEFQAREVRLRISDNGCGFDPGGPEATKPGHFGLVGMRERAEAIGGTLSLRSAPCGTEIMVTVSTG